MLHRNHCKTNNFNLSASVMLCSLMTKVIFQNLNSGRNKAVFDKQQTHRNIYVVAVRFYLVENLYMIPLQPSCQMPVLLLRNLGI